jgi:THO complex subunit 5
MHQVTDPALQNVLATAEATKQQCFNSLRPRHDATTEISNDPATLLAMIAELRMVHREAINSVRRAKQDTVESRREIDTLHLQLQNLYYEQRHLRGEISACESYE